MSKKKTTKQVESKETPAVLLSRPHDVSLFTGTETDGAFWFVRYNADNKTIEATTGKIAIRVPVDVNNMPGERTLPESFAISPHDLKRCIKQSEDRVIVETKPGQFKDSQKLIILTGFATTTPVVHTVEDNPARFPNTGPIFDGATGKTALTLNAKALKRIAEYAIKRGYMEQVTFIFDEKDDFVPVRFEIPVRSDVTAEGVVMQTKKYVK